jgi:NitT/TauT family transport system substrate-binding protein
MTMTTRSSTRALIALAVVAGLLGGGSGPAWSAPAKVTVGYSKLRISLPIFVAAKHGYFADEQLDVTLQSFDTAVPLMDALVAGHLPMGGFTAFPITFNSMLRSGTPLYFVGLLQEDSEHPISMLLRKKGAAISGVADLKGKRVGILPTIAYRKWLEVVLQKNGVDPATVAIIDVQPALTASSLESGAIEAAFTNDPAATACLRKGVAELVTPEALVPKYFGSPFPFGAFNISKAYADTHPDVVKRIVRALNRAVDFVNANPADAKAAMRPFLPEEQRQFVAFYPDALFVRSDKVDGAVLKKMAQSLLDLGIIKQPISLDGLLYR